MKKILAVLLAIISVFAITGCESLRAKEETEVAELQGVELLSGKKPKELYYSAIDYIKSLVNYEIIMEAKYKQTYKEESREESATTLYKTSGETLVYSYTIEDYSEHFIHDGNMLYQQLNGVKEKHSASYDEVVSSLGNVVESGMLVELNDSNFEGKRFISEGNLYTLYFLISPDEYQELFGVSLETPAKYKVYFDTAGRIVRFERTLEYYYNEVFVEDYINTTINHVGEVEKISAPEDAEAYAVRPSAEEIDLTPVESLDGFEDTDKVTNYVLMSFRIDGYVPKESAESSKLETVTATDATSEPEAESETEAQSETEAESETATGEESKAEETDVYEGSILIRLYPDVAPATVANFQNLVGTATYNGMVVSSIIENFAFQISEPIVSEESSDNAETEAESEKICDPIFGEFGSNGFTNNLSHKRGVVSMLRGEDPNSATYPFFICTRDFVNLDGSYASFGSVVYGFDVVDVIAGIETDDNDAPKSTVTVTSAKFVSPKAQ